MRRGVPCLRGDTVEWAVLGIFCASLLLCIALDASILYALAFGLILFLLYGRKRGFPWGELLRMALNGVKTVRNVLITFLLIGMMTAFWRAAGTIPVIVGYASGLIRPSVFLLMTFLLDCGVSFMTGTAFGTAATMGVICATMGAAMGMSPVLTGGAVLSGVFFGDRCSPVSTSALLVAAITDTDIYGNIRRMLKSALIPFLLSCLIYLLLGFAGTGGSAAIDLKALFSRSFRLSWVALIPAAAVLLLSLLRADVKLSMGAGILTAIPICLAVQNIPPAELLRIAAVGFYPRDAEVAAMVSGGGLLSMLKVAGIVCLSSSYSELFRKTGLLDGIRRRISAVSRKSTPYAAVLLTSAVSGLIACNQTLTILLADQLCKGEYDEKSRLALDLEDSAVVIAPLIPWSIAGGVPLASIGAPTAAILAAFYLFLIPLYRLVAGLRKNR